MGRGRVIPGNTTTTVAVVCGPDRQSIQAASLGMATNTWSPMAAGMHSPGASARGFVGDCGYGVSRMGGRTDPVQVFHGAAGAIRAVQNPKSPRLGLGAGVAGQPGLPNTGVGDPFGRYSGVGWGA